MCGEVSCVSEIFDHIKQLTVLHGYSLYYTGTPVRFRISLVAWVSLNQFYLYVYVFVINTRSFIKFDNSFYKSIIEVCINKWEHVTRLTCKDFSLWLLFDHKRCTFIDYMCNNLLQSLFVTSFLPTLWTISSPLVLNVIVQSWYKDNRDVAEFINMSNLSINFIQCSSHVDRLTNCYVIHYINLLLLPISDRFPNWST